MKKMSVFFCLVVCIFMGSYAYAEVDCRLDGEPCVKTLAQDNIKVTFDITPKPVVFMQELTFKITLHQDNRPINDAKITMDLNMPGMFMGKNSPAIKHLKDGIYEGRGIIPRCPSGKKVWQANISIERKGMTARVDFTFEGK